MFDLDDYLFCSFGWYVLYFDFVQTMCRNCSKALLILLDTQSSYQLVNFLWKSSSNYLKLVIEQFSTWTTSKKLYQKWFYKYQIKRDINTHDLHGKWARKKCQKFPSENMYVTVGYILSVLHSFLLRWISIFCFFCYKVFSPKTFLTHV